jgi:transcriptional regulator with PAS, ATPase and Fis domain
MLPDTDAAGSHVSVFSGPPQFLHAQGGTLFLDEIGELPYMLQSKLLRVLEDRRVRPVGSEREIPFDARFVFATNVDLKRCVEAGTFRSDLYFRINVMQIHLPPLRDRGGDVEQLRRAFHARTCSAARHASCHDRR